MKITLDELISRGACETQYEIIKELFGNEIEVNKENVEKAIGNNLDLFWLEFGWPEVSNYISHLFNQIPIGTVVKLNRLTEEERNKNPFGYGQKMEDAEGSNGTIESIGLHKKGFIYNIKISDYGTFYYLRENFTLPEMITKGEKNE